MSNRNLKNNEDDELFKAKITEEQQQKDKAQHEFEQEYNKKTKKQPGTRKEEVEEPIASESEIGSHQKAKGKKKFRAFIRGIRRRSVWKKIVFHLRSLFNTKAALKEEALSQENIKKLELLFGFKLKLNDKQQNIKVAFLLERLHQLKTQHVKLAALDKILQGTQAMAIRTVAEHYMRSQSNMQKQETIATKHLTSQIAQNHATTINHTQRTATKVNMDLQPSILSSGISKNTNSNDMNAAYYMPHLRQSTPQLLPTVTMHMNLTLLERVVNFVESKVTQAVKSVAEQAKHYIIDKITSSTDYSHDAKGYSIKPPIIDINKGSHTSIYSNLTTQIYPYNINLQFEITKITMINNSPGFNLDNTNLQTFDAAITINKT